MKRNGVRYSVGKTKLWLRGTTIEALCLVINLRQILSIRMLCKSEQKRSICIKILNNNFSLLNSIRVTFVKKFANSRPSSFMDQPPNTRRKETRIKQGTAIYWRPPSVMIFLASGNAPRVINITRSCIARRIGWRVKRRGEWRGCRGVFAIIAMIRVATAYGWWGFNAALRFHEGSICTPT